MTQATTPRSAAKRLNGFASDLHRAFTGKQDGTRRIKACGLPRVTCPRDIVDIAACRIERDIHIGDLRLHKLKTADGLTELLAFAHIR